MKGGTPSSRRRRLQNGRSAWSTTSLPHVSGKVKFRAAARGLPPHHDAARRAADEPAAPCATHAPHTYGGLRSNRSPPARMPRLSAMKPSRARSHVTAFSILGLALALFLASAGAANDTPAPLGPLGVVQSSVARVLGIVQSWPIGSDERRIGIIRVSHELFDFHEIARRALGQHWKGLSPGEQDEFVYLFTDVLDRAFLASVDGYTDEKVTFVGEAIDGPWAQVHSRIIPNTGAAVSIDYRLHEVNLRWAVYDVVSERMSLVASYRSQFNSVLRASSFAELLGRMRTDRVRRRASSTQTPFLPWTAGLLFAVPHEPSASPAAPGSSHEMEVR